MDFRSYLNKQKTITEEELYTLKSNNYSTKVLKDKLLQEKASYTRTTAKLMSMSRIPLTDDVVKVLGFSKKMKTLHATTLEHLKNLSKLGKSKNQISTFTRGLGGLIGSIAVYPDVVAELYGKSVIEFDFDIFSHPDKQGRRWISSYGNKKSKFLQETINTKPIKLIFELLHKQNEELPYDKDKFIDKMLIKNTFYISQFDKLTNDNKSLVVQKYFDNISNIMTNEIYIKIIKEIISGSNKKVGNYNEIIMNQFKVIGVYSIEAGKFQFNNSSAKHIIEKEGYKYLGHISKEKFNNFSV